MRTGAIIFLGSAVSLCLLATATWAAGSATPTRSAPNAKVDSPQLPSPPTGGACIQATKEAEKGVSLNLAGGELTFKGATFVFEAEALLAQGRAHANAGGLTVQQMAGFGSGWGGDAQLFWSGGDLGAVLDLTFSLAKGGSHRVYVHLTRAPDFGQLKAQVMVAPKPKTAWSEAEGPAWDSAGLFDGWDASVKPPPELQPLIILPHWVNLVEGENKLSLMIVGKNNKSTGYLVGIDCIAVQAQYP